MAKKAYQLRIYPNKKQAQLFRQTFGCVRFVYNQFLDAWNTAFKLTGKGLSKGTCIKSIPVLKKQFAFLKEVDSIALQAACEDLSDAFDRFFKKQNKEPVFKSRKRPRQSYTTKCVNKNIAIIDRKLKLPKVGLLRVAWSYDLTNKKIKRATISMDACGHFYVSLLIEEDIQPLPKTKATVGIDVGLTRFCTLSDSTLVKNPRPFLILEKQLAKAQRILSRRILRAKADGRKIGEARNVQKARKRVAKIHKRIANTRRDYLHKLSIQLVRDYDLIAVESLRVDRLLKNRHLSKHIADVSWSSFFTMVKYKCKWYDKQFVAVAAAYTSQTCHHCQHVDKESRVTQLQFVCTRCGHKADADVNAAKNILQKAV
jgi:putative transposase